MEMGNLGKLELYTNENATSGVLHEGQNNREIHNMMNFIR